jgi:hypothetical protein
MRKQVEASQRCELTDVTAKVAIYEAFVEGRLEAPKHLARAVDHLYFEPKYEEFRPRPIWSLSNAFTSAFKKLEPISRFQATVKLGEFLETRLSKLFWLTAVSAGPPLLVTFYGLAAPRPNWFPRSPFMVQSLDSR